MAPSDMIDTGRGVNGVSFDSVGELVGSERGPGPRGVRGEDVCVGGVDGAFGGVLEQAV